MNTVKPVYNGHSQKDQKMVFKTETATLKKTPKNGFQDRLLLNAGQKYCRMLPLEHSAILSTFIKLPAVIKTLILEWLFYTGFTVCV